MAKIHTGTEKGVTFTPAQVAWGADALEFVLEPETWPVFAAWLAAGSDIPPGEQLRIRCEEAMQALTELAEAMAAAAVNPDARPRLVRGWPGTQ